MRKKVTDEQRTTYFNRVDQNIKEHGFHVTTVLEDKETTPFGYSTGIYKNFEIPEIFISGLPGNLTHQLIVDYCNKYKLQTVPLKRTISDLTDRFPIYFIKVKIPSIEEYILSSIRYYSNNEYEYLQLIFPDLRGNFPGEENYNYDQEIFGDILH